MKAQNGWVNAHLALAGILLLKRSNKKREVPRPFLKTQQYNKIELKKFPTPPKGKSIKNVNVIINIDNDNQNH